MNELELLEEADRRARDYIANAPGQAVFPKAADVAGLSRFNEPLSAAGRGDAETLALLDEAGSPATVVSNGARYFGFVIGATLPVAAAAERMSLAWDQCASSFDNSPAAHMIEKQAARWVLDILDLPRESAVSFGTSASACGLSCLVAARRALLAQSGWDFDRNGLANAPLVRVVISELAHVTIKKALRIMGFGLDHVLLAPVDQQGRIVPAKLPPLDSRTILCLQAGEVNTGEFDPFEALIARARKASAWVHVDGAFGLWARATPDLQSLTQGVEAADSWTTDGHKWLNTPYDGAMGICRDAAALAGAMNSDADYAQSAVDSQRNLGLEFSRRARGIAVWAALRSLGRDGVASLVSGNAAQAKRLATGLADGGFDIINRVVLNQVLFRLESPAATLALREAAVATGAIWFGSTRWQGQPALRLSVSSWRTADDDIDAAIRLLCDLKTRLQ